MDSLLNSVRRFLDEQSGQKLKNAMINDPLFKEAHAVVEDGLMEGKSVMADVWDMLIERSEALDLSAETVRKWQQAVVALLPYAINLYLAPNRPEFTRVKVGVTHTCTWSTRWCFICFYGYQYALILALASVHIVILLESQTQPQV